MYCHVSFFGGAAQWGPPVVVKLGHPCGSLSLSRSRLGRRLLPFGPEKTEQKFWQEGGILD